MIHKSLIQNEKGAKAMFKKTIAITLTLMLVFTMVGGTTVLGESTKSKIGNIEKKIDKKEDQIQANNKKQKELKDKISSLESSISATESDLASIRKEITEMNAKTTKITAKVVKLEKKIDTQQETLDLRLRSMYKNGNLGIIQVLLGSVNIQDFMSNFKLIKELHKSDVNILKELEINHKEVKKKKKELEAIASKLKSHEAAQVTKQKQLESDKVAVAAAKAKVEAENSVLYKEIDKLNAESDRLSAEIASMQDSNTEYKGNGKFAWPFPGYSRVSSEYGYRTHPISGKKKFHSGIDLAGSSGKSIVAADDGKVISAGWNSGGYGNMVVIDHGSGISTVYAHNSSLSVSKGQTVKRGQTVAKCGSTGYSTGPHLHFEVRVNGKTQNPRNWI